MSATGTSRRTFVAWTLAAGIWPRLLGAAEGDRRHEFAADFHPNAELAAALLPPGLELPDEPRLRLELGTVEPRAKSLLEPEAWGWARLSLSARAGETLGWVPLRSFVSNERALRVARERFGLPAVWAEIRLALEGETVSASIVADGRPVLSLRMQREDGAAQDAADPSPLLVWTGEPALDWRQEGGRLSGARLTQLARPSAVPAERRACSLQSLDSPWELGEWAGGWYGEAAEAAGGPLGEATALRRFEAAEAAGWSPLDYPLDATRSPLTPARLTETSLKALAEKREVALRSMEAVELDVMVPTEAHEALLPPMCRSGGRPMLKILGLRVHESDLSPEPFQEAWLFAFAIVAGRAGWYAVSHIVEPPGDAVYGREAFGYPSKFGRPEVVATPVDFSFTVARMGREAFFAGGAFKGFATGTSLGQLPVLTLRARPGGESAEILYQMWTFQGRRNRVDPATLETTAPEPAAEGLELKADPWFELNPLRPVAVSAMDGGKMQRSPAESLLTWPDFQDYYRERCDGVLPWEDRPAKPRQPTLLVRPASGPRS